MHHGEKSHNFNSYKRKVISWGNLDGPPVLMVHGREDSAATFLPLLDLLPATNYYVGVDLPGHGRSDPLPTGAMLSRMHLVGAVEHVVRHLKWSDFVYIGHSMGSDTGLFFNAVFPNRIAKFVLLDPMPSISRLQVHDPEEHYRMFHGNYYDNYIKINAAGKLYSKKQIVESVRRARGFTEAQAELVLTRNLTKVGDDLYQLSFDRRLKFPAAPNYPPDFYSHVWSKNCPPTLLVSARDAKPGYEKGMLATRKIVSDMEKNVQNFFVINVDGDHSVHFTNPERFIKELCEFLDKKFERKSKL